METAENRNKSFFGEEADEDDSVTDGSIDARNSFKSLIFINNFRLKLNEFSCKIIHNCWSELSQFQIEANLSLLKILNPIQVYSIESWI